MADALPLFEALADEPAASVMLPLGAGPDLALTLSPLPARQGAVPAA
jgi:hypothetical protein